MYRIIPLLTICIFLIACAPANSDTTLNVSTGVGNSTATTGVDPVTYTVTGQNVNIEGADGSVKYDITSAGLKIGSIVVPSFTLVDEQNNVVATVTWSASEETRTASVPLTPSEQIAAEGRVARPEEVQFTENENYVYHSRRGLFRRRR